jgi:multidrug efflux pump subunit AcrA (membrane-fusion protein)
LQEYPSLTYTGKVTRTSSSLDAGSRTLLTEVQVDNPRGIMLPGMYALVSFLTRRAEPPLLIPNASLVTQSSGTLVAVLAPLDEQQRSRAASQGMDAATLSRSRAVHFQRVEPGRDYGVELEILSGLRGDEEVVVDPSDSVREGAIVQVGGGAKQ